MKCDEVSFPYSSNACDDKSSRAQRWKICSTLYYRTIVSIFHQLILTI